MSDDVRWIDLETWPRRKHFELFNGFAYPYFNVCADVDVARLVRSVKARGSHFTAHLIYLLARVANEIPEFRCRIRGDGVVEHSVIHPSATIATENDLFSFCLFDYCEDPTVFVPAAIEAIAEARRNPSVEDVVGRDDYLFMAIFPWVSFRSVMHPVPLDPPDSFPRIAWGRYRTEGERIPMPLSVHAHHGLMDGIHVGRYFEQVQELITSTDQWADGIE